MAEELIPKIGIANTIYLFYNLIMNKGSEVNYGKIISRKKYYVYRLKEFLCLM